MQGGWRCCACNKKLFRKFAGFCTELTAMLRVQNILSQKGRKPLSGGQGRFQISPLRPPNNPLTRGVTSCAGSNLPQAEDATRFAVPPFPMESPLRYHFPWGPKEGCSGGARLSGKAVPRLHAAPTRRVYMKICASPVSLVQNYQCCFA